jgi:hypothetical protein
MFSPRRKKLSGEDIQRISMKRRNERRREEREEGRWGEVRQDKTKKQGKL